MSVLHPLPDGWTRRRLRFDAEVNPVKSELDLPDDTEVSFVPMDAVGEYGGLRLDETRTLDDVYTGYTYLADGDVCVAKITPCFENGKGALSDGLTNGVGFGTTELHVIRPSGGLDRRFLLYLTMAADFRSFGEAEMVGAGGQKRVPTEFVRDWRPPLPPLDVQRRIVRFLDEKTERIDALIGKKRALLDRLAEKRQSLITHAVTKGLNPDIRLIPSGVAWLGDVPAHWEVKPLRRVRRYMTSGSRGWAAYYSDEGVAFLRMTNVTGDGIELDLTDLRFVDLGDNVSEGTRTAVKEGDILITITAELGAVAVVRADAEGSYINQHLALFRADPHLCTPDFLVNFLSSGVARAQLILSGQGGAKQGLGFEQVSNVVGGFPPLAEQEQIGTYCTQVRKQYERPLAAVQTSLAYLNEYRAALVTAAVTGQIEDLT